VASNEETRLTVIGGIVAYARALDLLGQAAYNGQRNKRWPEQASSTATDVMFLLETAYSIGVSECHSPSMADHFT